MDKYVSRAGDKLDFALEAFKVNPANLVCADFGSSTGGFIDCLLKKGAAKVYSVEVAYGELDWGLRNNPKVVVMEKTNAMHITLPEKVDLITIDVGWTKQVLILPNALANLKDNGQVISLIKPHYEAPKNFLRQGKLMAEKIDEVVNQVENDIQSIGFDVINVVASPILGGKAKNKEFLCLVKKSVVNS